MRHFQIETPDGLGEATKTDRNEPWHVALPSTEFDFYGSSTQVKAKIKKIIRREYPNEDK